MMNTTLAKYITGGLSNPSKMPGFSYGLPAAGAKWVPELATKYNLEVPETFGCPVGAKLAQVKGTTCSKCYAVKGNYGFKKVRLAQFKRLMGLLTHPMWVDAMVHLINSKRSKWFRWHDSGDIMSMDHLHKIIEVVNRTPDVRHWLPTREAKIIVDYENTYGAFPDNLTIRLSATRVDNPPPKAYGITSTVHDKAAPVGHKCPAPEQNGECGDCRACWSRDVENVSYHIH